MIGRPYSVKINVHKQDPDSLQWTNGLLGNEFNAGVLTRQKAVYADTKIYVFGVDMNGQTVAECMEIDSDNNPGKWTSVKLPQNTDSYSATICNGTIYFLADGCLFTLTSYGYRQCSSVTDITQLLAGTLSNGEGLLYTRIGEDQFPTYNVYSQEWNDSDAELEDCPSTSQRISSVNIPLTYNDKINRTILFGYNEADPKGYGFVATRLTNDDSWTTYDYARIDTFRCPNIIDPTMIYYDKKLYAFGGQIATRAYTYAPFSIFFSSTDNGLTWQPVTENVTFPKGSNSFQQYYKGEGSYSCVVDKNNFIWVVWEDGQMCRGRINHFGFAPKWD